MSSAANNAAIPRIRDTSAGTMPIVVKYFCQRGHLCEADHLVASHQLAAKKEARALDRSLLPMKSDQSA